MPVRTSLSGILPAIIDTHMHQWDPFTTPREARLAAQIYRHSPKLLERLLPILADRASREYILTPKHVATPYLLDDYAADVGGVVSEVGVSVEAAVHIEAGWLSDKPAEETAWLHQLSERRKNAPRLAAIIGRADPRRPDFASTLDAHARAGTRFRGIRWMTAWHPDPDVKNWIDHDGVLVSTPFLRGFEELARRGLSFDAYVYSRQLKDVAALARKFPGTTIVLDHLGPPVGWLGPVGSGTGRTGAERREIFQRWRDAIAAVASCPNVIAKQSGIAAPVLGLREVGITRERLAAHVAPMVKHVADVFGPERIMFGSNFPMDKSLASYATIVGALADILAARGDNLLRRIFRDNAIAVYRL